MMPASCRLDGRLLLCTHIEIFSIQQIFHTCNYFQPHIIKNAFVGGLLSHQAVFTYSRRILPFHLPPLIEIQNVTLAISFETLLIYTVLGPLSLFSFRVLKLNLDCHIEDFR
jgi:hypothetical protein